MDNLKGQVFKYIKPNLGILLLAMGFMVLNALATGFYAYLIGPVVKFFFAGSIDNPDGILGFITDLGLNPDIKTGEYALFVLPALILFVAFIKGVSQFGKFFLMGVLGEKSVFNLRKDLLARLHNLSFRIKDKASSGDLITRMVSDITLLQESITNAIGSIIADSLKVIVLLGVAVYLDWRLAIVSFVVLPLVAVPIVKVGKRLKRTSEKCQIAKAKIATHVEEDAHSFALIKNYLLSKERAETFTKLNKKYYLASMSSYGVRGMASPIMEMMGALGLAGTIWLAGTQIASGNLLPENFISFFAAVLMMYEPMKNLGRLNTVFQSGRAGAERVFEILDWEEETDNGNQSIREFKDEIAFSEIGFSFDDRTVFDRISFSVKKGTSLAIVGSSGVGKSTLMRLLLRHYEIQNGSVAIDSVDIKSITLKNLRSLITMVEQRPIIFNASIWDNIKIAKNNASDTDIEEAIAKASLTKFVNCLPMKEKTEVGERGVLLSEGEKQRIALARAFLRASPVVILDEVTSALDSENETAIKSAIAELTKTKTVIIIAHRLSTISDVDEILVLENGKIAEQGKHRDLIELDGEYKKYWSLQN